MTMELEFEAITATVDAADGSGEEHIAPSRDRSGVVSVGPVEVTLAGGRSAFSWSVANRGDRPVRIRSVAVVLRVGGVTEPLHMFRHGYQSWSWSGVATLGVHADPSVLANLPFVQGVYHADGHTVRDGELRSEWCTVLRDATGAQVVLGFDGGAAHDGTFRLWRRDDGGIELSVEAFFGGAELGPGEVRSLHGVSWTDEDGMASELLAAWAARVGRAEGARVTAPFRVGWCSWYHYFDQVTEADLRSNLAGAHGWPFDVFQLDDGYQAAIGDWTDTNAKFPSSLDALAAEIAGAGFTPGLWLAPFLLAPDSQVARQHPEWIARLPGPAAEPLRSWWNPAWEGGEDGLMYSLDTSNPEVLQHLERLARDICDAGFGYLKLDFTFAASIDGRWFDPSLTPAQRVRAGFDAMRRGAGDDVFILGCGVPLANVVGVVDANRIGPDVAPLWSLQPEAEIVAGYLNVEPATRSALAATAARSFMHRQLWLNDPDCIMLRSSSTDLDPVAAQTWDRFVGISGGLVVVSDDLDCVGPEAKSRLHEVVAIGRESDDRARSGTPPRCPDLMDHDIPTTLATDRYEIVVDPDAGSSAFRER